MEYYGTARGATGLLWDAHGPPQKFPGDCRGFVAWDCHDVMVLSRAALGLWHGTAVRLSCNSTSWNPIGLQPDAMALLAMAT